MNLFRRLSSLACATTLLLVGAGGLVRATGSGLGCRDQWPLCSGGWIAPFEYHAVIEYTHRVLAVLVVVLLAALLIASRSVRGGLRRASGAALVVVVLQALLGRAVVVRELHVQLVTAHFALAMLLVALTVGIAVRAHSGAGVKSRGAAAPTVAAFMVLAQLFVGMLVREKGAGLAFPDWPLMNGSILPSLVASGATLHFLHRGVALLVFGYVLFVAARARRDDRRLVRIFGLSAAALFAVQIALGGLSVITSLGPVAVIGHVTVAALVWASAVGLAVAVRSEQLSLQTPSRFPSYLALMKPRIIVLLLITTLPAMVLAKGGFPSVALMFSTLAGGMLTAGGANAINQFLERDIDRKMNRTARRPLPAHAIEPWRAVVFGASLVVLGVFWLVVTVNLLSAALALSAMVFYAGFYTLVLKRSTPQNIVIGGAAGAVPALVGWAAVTGSLALPAWIMFAIIFVWTPPHFWALSVKYVGDYAAAGVPMMPVVRGISSTTRQILGYAIALVAVTLTLVPAAGLSLVYGVGAIGLGGVFVYLAWRLWRIQDVRAAMRLFHYSVAYLGLLFVAMAADKLVLG